MFFILLEINILLCIMLRMLHMLFYLNNSDKSVKSLLTSLITYIVQIVNKNITFVRNHNYKVHSLYKFA
jgi:hypothetical protein